LDILSCGKGFKQIALVRRRYNCNERRFMSRPLSVKARPSNHGIGLTLLGSQKIACSHPGLSLDLLFMERAGMSLVTHAHSLVLQLSEALKGDYTMEWRIHRFIERVKTVAYWWAASMGNPCSLLLLGLGPSKDGSVVVWDPQIDPSGGRSRGMHSLPL